MKAIQFTETFAKVHDFALQYNEQFCTTGSSGQPVCAYKHCLRANHVSLLHQLIKCYAGQLQSAPLLFAGSLPPLLTTNEALAHRTHLSARTVQRLLNRLVEANAISHKIFHGSRAPIELHLNPDLLTFYPHIAVGSPEVSTTASTKNTCNQPFTNTVASTCPHKDTGSLIKEVTSDDDCGKTENTTGGILTGNIVTGDTGQDAGAARQADENLPDVPPRLAHFPPHVEQLFTLMMGTIFTRLSYLSDREITQGKQFLMAYFTDAADVQVRFRELAARVWLAENYLKRHAARFVPIPSIYLHPDNPNGFAGTARWTQPANRRRTALHVQQYRQFVHQWTAFQQAASVQQPNDLTAYIRHKQWLQKTYPELVTAYDTLMASRFCA